MNLNDVSKDIGEYERRFDLLLTAIDKNQAPAMAQVRNSLNQMIISAGANIRDISSDLVKHSIRNK
jgi:hypothetical protein